MGMNALFEVEPLLPNGFRYQTNFISPAEEAQLLDMISRMELHTFLFQGYEAKRKVASFGYDWSFEKRVLSKGKEIPEVFVWLLEKVAHFIEVPVQNMVELLVTEYP